MLNPVAHRVSSEHQCLLNLAEEIENCLIESRYTDSCSYNHAQEMVRELRHHYINTHLPKDRLLSDRFSKSLARSRQHMATVLNYHARTVRENLERLDTNLTVVTLAQPMPRQVLLEDGLRALRSLRSVIAFEEETALLWADRHMSAETWQELGTQFDALNFNCDHKHH